MDKTAVPRPTGVRRLASNGVVQDVAFITINLYAALMLACLDVYIRRSRFYLPIYGNDTDWRFLDADSIVQYIQSNQKLVNHQLEDATKHAGRGGWFYHAMPPFVSNPGVLVLCVGTILHIFAWVAVQARYRRGRFFNTVRYSTCSAIFVWNVVEHRMDLMGYVLPWIWGILAMDAGLVIVHRALGENAWRTDYFDPIGFEGNLWRAMDRHLGNVEDAVV